jgi:hydroxymethylbilane synthase
MRGNVETRLRKLAEQDLDALILAQAGLERLGLGSAITEVLDPEWMLPAVGQGALGLECRRADRATREIVEPLNHLATQQAVLAERAFLRALGGGCLVPIGVAVTVVEENLFLRGAVLSPDGKERIAGEMSGIAAIAEGVGQRLAADLLARGAERLLSTPAH